MVFIQIAKLAPEEDLTWNMVDFSKWNIKFLIFVLEDKF